MDNKPDEAEENLIYYYNYSENFIDLLNDKKKLDEIRQNMQNYISNQPLASEEIIKTIFSND